MNLILFIQAFTFGWLMGCATAAVVSVIVFCLAYYLRPYIKKVRRAKRIKKSADKKNGAKKAKIENEKDSYMDLIIPIVALSIVIIGVWWIIHTHVIGHIPGWFWWLLIIIAVLVIIAVVFNKLGDKITVPSINTTQLPKFIGGLLTWLIAIIVIIALAFMIWLYLPDLKRWWNTKSESRTSETTNRPVTYVDNFPSIQTVTYGRYHFIKGMKYKFLMLGRDVDGAEHYFTPHNLGVTYFSYHKLGYESQVYWTYKVTRDGKNPVEYRLMQNQNEGTGGWISVIASRTGYVDITPEKVPY